MDIPGESLAIVQQEASHAFVGGKDYISPRSAGSKQAAVISALEGSVW